MCSVGAVSLVDAVGEGTDGAGAGRKCARGAAPRAHYPLNEEHTKCATPGCDGVKLRPGRAGSVCYVCMQARLQGKSSSAAPTPPPADELATEAPVDTPRAFAVPATSPMLACAETGSTDTRHLEEANGVLAAAADDHAAQKMHVALASTAAPSPTTASAHSRLLCRQQVDVAARAPSRTPHAGDRATVHEVREHTHAHPERLANRAHAQDQIQVGPAVDDFAEQPELLDLPMTVAVIASTRPTNVIFTPRLHAVGTQSALVCKAQAVCLGDSDQDEALGGMYTPGICV
jgi:hypothetical protein